MTGGEERAINAGRATPKDTLRLLHVLPSLDVGGVQTRLVNIANALPRRFEHVFIALDRRYAALDRLEAQVRHSIVPTPVHSRSFVRRLACYARTIGRNHPDLLLTYNWGSIEFALANAWTGRPHLHAEDGFGPEEATRQLRRRVWLRRAALRRSVVVVPSEGLFESARQDWWIAPTRLMRIPNGIDLGRFAPQSKGAARAILGLDDDAFVLGWVGALRPEKNLPRLLRAFAGVPAPARLVIIGGGALRESLIALTVDLRIADRVAWLGSRSDVSELLPAFDALVLSSDTEQMPIVVMEAMAAGLAVASVDVGDVRAMVAAENKPFVTARSDTALAQALAALAADKPRCAATGRANRAKALSDFDLQKMVDAYCALYAGIAAA